MILEHALLTVRPGEASVFEQAMHQAAPLISATPGFVGMSVRPCLEKANLYLLLVEWESLEAHEIGFRKSDRYSEWSKLLHGYYDPFPEVLHFGAAIAQGA